MKRVILILIVLILMPVFSGCTQNMDQSAKSITICAASSLRDVLNEIQPKFEQETGIKLTFNFASSGALQKQIEEGAPADVFISAGEKQMDALESKNLIYKESRRNLLGNKLVLVVPDEYLNDIKTASDLADIDAKISIGEPESVPAGQYAKEALISLSLWDKLKGKIVYAKDVKQVVAYVEKGEIAAGIVYNSDATALKSSTVVQAFDEGSHMPIVYPQAIISSGMDKESAKAFCDYLNTAGAKLLFEEYGFDTDME